MCSDGLNPSDINCELCVNRGGALRSTDTPGSWVHSLCARSIPEIFELQPNDHNEDSRNESLHSSYSLINLDKKRFKLKCNMCTSFGACIQCAYGRCTLAAHPWCVLKYPNGFTHRSAKDEDDWTSLEIFCQAHSKLDTKSRKVRKRNRKSSNSSKMDVSVDELVLSTEEKQFLDCSIDVINDIQAVDNSIDSPTPITDISISRDEKDTSSQSISPINITNDNIVTSPEKDIIDLSNDITDNVERDNLKLITLQEVILDVQLKEDDYNNVNEGVYKMCCLCEDLATSSISQSFFSKMNEIGGCEYLLTLVDKYRKEESVICNIFMTIASIISRDKSQTNNLVIGSILACEKIINTVKYYLINVRIVEEGCIAISNIASKSHENKVNLGHSGACDLIDIVIRKHIDIKPIVKLGCDIMKRLSAIGTNEKILFRLGAWNVLLNILEIHSNDVILVRYTLAVMKSIANAYFANNSPYLVTVEALVATVDKFISNEAVAEDGLYLLRSIYHRNMENKLKLILTDVGAIELIIDVMKHHLNVVSITREGCRAISSLINDNWDVKRLENTGIEILTLIITYYILFCTIRSL